MTGFLNGKNARQFMDELWALLLSAQESDTGIPSEFIQQKKDEILKREEENKLLEQIKLDNNDIDKSRDRGRSSPSKERLASRSKSTSPAGVKKFSKSPEKQDKEVVRNSTDKLKVQRKSVDRNDRSKDRPSARSPGPKSRGSVDKSKDQRPSKAHSKDRLDAKLKDRRKSADRERERSKERNDKPRERKRSRSRRKSKERKRSRDRSSRDRSGNQGKSRDHRSRSRQRSMDKSRDVAKRRSSRSPRPRRRTRSRSTTPKAESRYRRSSLERRDKRNKSRSPLRPRKRSPSEQNGTKSSSGDITKIQAKLLNMAENNAAKSTKSVSPVQADKPNPTKRDKSTSRSLSK